MGPADVTCTFSTTCGLKTNYLRTFFHTGQWDDVSSDSLHMLVPVLFEQDEIKREIKPIADLIPLLNLQSGRTPGCLSTSAMATLTCLLSLCPNELTVQGHSEEIHKPWLDFLKSLLFQSPSPIIRRFSADSVYIIISHVKMSHMILLERYQFMLKYLVRVIKVRSISWNYVYSSVEVVLSCVYVYLQEAESNTGLHCSDGVDLFLQIIGCLLAHDHKPSFFSDMFTDEWNWLLKSVGLTYICHLDSTPLY